MPMIDQPVIAVDLGASLAALRPFQNLIILTLVLTAPLILGSLLRTRLGAWASDRRRLGRTGLALFLLMASSAHFFDAEQMALMLPEWVPSRLTFIYVTGGLEIALAALLFVGGAWRLAGAAIAAMLILFLPANIYAAMNSLPFGGHEMGPAYLLVRVPYQLFLVWWTLWSTGWIERDA